MIGMTVKVHGLDGVRKMIRGVQKRATGPFDDPKFAEYVGSRGFTQIIKNFRAQSGPGGKWPELAESTKKRRPASSPMLQISGLLRGATKWRKHGKAAMLFINMSKRSATHNYGRPPVGGFKQAIPQREFMWFPNDFLKKAMNAYTKYVLNGHV